MYFLDWKTYEFGGACIMATGAINVVRGSRSSVEELLQIYKHSQRLG